MRLTVSNTSTAQGGAPGSVVTDARRYSAAAVRVGWPQLIPATHRSLHRPRVSAVRDGRDHVGMTMEGAVGMSLHEPIGRQHSNRQSSRPS